MKWFNKNKTIKNTATSSYENFIKGVDADNSSLSGMYVSEENSITVSGVFACVRVIAEDIASLPLPLYKRLSRGKEKAVDHPLYYLIHDSPNEEMTAFAFKEAMMTNLLLWGNAYAQIIRDKHGQILSLYCYVIGFIILSDEYKMNGNGSVNMGGSSTGVSSISGNGASASGNYSAGFNFGSSKGYGAFTVNSGSAEGKARFITVYNTLIPNRENILDDCRRMMDVLTDTTEIDGKIAELLQEAEVVTGLTRKLIEENAAKALDPAEFSRKYKGYEDRYNGLKEKVEKLQKQSEQRKAQADSISAFMFELHETGEPVTEFDSKLWLSVIDSVVVKRNGKLLFRFRNGMEIER